MTQPEVRRITITDAAYKDMLTLRDEVLRKPLGMSVYNDDLSKDADDIMLVAFAGDAAVGCTMLKPLGNQELKLRQMAVSAAWQGRGIGAMLVSVAEQEALNAGCTTIALNARETAIAFYERLGYKAEGPVFTEVNIPHRLMKKTWHESA